MAATSTTSSLSARWAALSCSALFCAAAFGGGSVFETDTLEHPMPATNQEFGNSVGLSGTLAIVGCPESNGDGGQAFVFERSGGVWSLTQALSSGESQPGNEYGDAVDIETPYAIVGDSATGSGTAYVYEDKLGQGWILRDTITPSDAQEGVDFDFGIAVARWGDFAVVGAPKAPGGGAVYVFRRDGMDWNEEFILQGSDTLAGDEFGAAVDMDGDYVIVGAPGADANGSNSGRVYIFVRNDEEGVGPLWEEELADTPAGFDGSDALGTSVAISLPWAAAGAPFAAPGADPASGSVQVYSKGPGPEWFTEDEFNSDSSTAFNSYGYSVSLDGNRLLVAGLVADSQKGAGYLYTLDASGDGGSIATETDVLQGSDSGTIDLFGNEVALNGDSALIGAPQNDTMGNNVGRAYIYEGLFDAAECPGDINGDLFVDSTDLNAVLSAFGSGSGGDADGDGDTDSSDLNIVLANFGEDCFPDPQ